MESKLFEGGRFAIKSKDMDGHGPLGTGNDCNNFHDQCPEIFD